jgi:RND family efflux transporter MFP subunit
MNTHLLKAKNYLVLSYTEWKQFHSALPSKKRYLLIALEVAILVGVLMLLIPDAKKEDTLTSSIRAVKVANLSELSLDAKSIPLVGTVTSVSEATILAEGSGKLTRVYRTIGDQVFAGQIIAEFENSGERASLLSAEGAYDQARASLQITKLNSSQSNQTLGDAKTQALSTISSAYIAMDDALRGKSDSAFRNAQFTDAKLLISVPDASLTLALERQRKALEQVLTTRNSKNNTLTIESDLEREVSFVIEELQTVRDYLDTLFSAYSKALPDALFSQSEIESQKTTVGIARSSIIGTLNTTIAARTSLTANKTAHQIAGGSLATSGTIAQAEAQVKQALGAYNAALSRYQKTIIRSPITGTLNSFSLQTGDYVSAFSQVAVVSNNKALEIISFINEDDAKRITLGGKVIIQMGANATTSGIVTKVAEALDPKTRKIEIRIGIHDADSGLMNGQSVRIAVSGNRKEVVGTPKITKSSIVSIPLSAVKLTPQGANVFTVSASSTLVAIPVKEGTVFGDQIQIISGLRGDESIVLDARGLKAELEVIVTQ